MVTPHLISGHWGTTRGDPLRAKLTSSRLVKWYPSMGITVTAVEAPIRSPSLFAISFVRVVLPDAGAPTTPIQY